MKTWEPLYPYIEARLKAAQPDRFRWPRAKSAGWIGPIHSPLREDKHPSFSVRPDSDSDPGAWTDHATGEKGSIADLAARLGIDPKVSTAPGVSPPPPRKSEPVQSLQEFAKRRKLNAATLRAFGVREVESHGRAALRYPTTLKIDRLKFLDGRKPKYMWARAGGSAHWYGLKGALRLMRSGTVYLVNGEPSVWACQGAGMAAVSLCAGEGAMPSADHVQALADAGIHEVRVVFDLDEAGREGALQAVEALTTTGLRAVALELPADLGPGGDVDDLHRRTGDEGLAEALEGLPQLKAEKASVVSAWESPIPLSSFDDLPPWPAGVLPGWLGDWVNAQSSFTETPHELAFCMALGAVSAAAARYLQLEVKSGYIEPLNIWTACVLPPGNRKSAVQKAAVAPIVEWEQEKAEEMKPEIAAAISERRTAEARAKKLRTQAASADNPNDFQNLSRQVAEIEADLPEVPSAPQIWGSGSTPEKLGMILATNPTENFAWLSSEAGALFEILAGRYNGGQSNLDITLKSWSGDPEKELRVGRETVLLNNPLLTVALSPQPAILQSLGKQTSFLGRGLLERFLYLLPRSGVGRRTLDGTPVPGPIEGAYWAGIRHLLDFKTEDGARDTIKMEAAAYAEWKSFALACERDMADGGRLEHYRDFGNKLSGQTARIAGVLHAAKYAGRETAKFRLDVETMGQAISIARVIREHSIRALDATATSPAITAAAHLWAWLRGRSEAKISLRDVHQSLRKTFPRVADLQAAAAILEERSIIRIENIHTGGRPKRMIEINPALKINTARMVHKSPQKVPRSDLLPTSVYRNGESKNQNGAVEDVLDIL